MGCPGCLLTEKELKELIDSISIKAKTDAVNNKKTYVLYNLPDGGVSYMEFEAARSAGIQPLKFISHFVPDANDSVP